MSLLLIKAMIIQEALKQGIDYKLALSVAAVESNYRQSAIGPIGGVGIFQLRPTKLNQRAIRSLKGNIHEGVKHLAFWKKHCPVKEDLTWVICYNGGFRHPKYPVKNTYYLKVRRVYDTTRKT